MYSIRKRFILKCIIIVRHQFLWLISAEEMTENATTYTIYDHDNERIAHHIKFVYAVKTSDNKWGLVVRHTLILFGKSKPYQIECNQE